ncbi:MAG: hypothetical protein BGO01_03790 [Armatimonadetes bacterium 55-13]|nr:MAG: hypothetical protein BGO01_03790 [Armatimonadetes bacterium 55-13]
MLSGTKRPHDMTRAEATEQFNEFIESLEWRIEYAKSIVKSSGIVETGDHREFVRAVGEWLVSVGELGTIPVEPNPKFGLPGAVLDLSFPTQSLCCWMALLFAEHLMDEVDGVHWTLCTDNKRNIYYHKPMLVREGSTAQLEPVNIVMNFLRGRLHKDRKPKTLDEFWLLWKEWLQAST